MRLAILGCAGSVGKRVVIRTLNQGHTVVGVDVASTYGSTEHDSNPDFTYTKLDLREYDQVLKILNGCHAIVQLAAFRDPGDYAVQTHNANVVISWNILRAAAELGIERIAQASSVNVITMVYSQKPQFDYFPIDEDHPCLPDEPYGLSKVICELQAQTIVRRYPSMRIASLRLHWSLPDRSAAIRSGLDSVKHAKDLWGYVQEDSSAEAFLLALADSDKWSGHEAFFITAPEIVIDTNSNVLREEYYPDVPIKEDWNVSGRQGFFDCSKAKRLLGWVHKDGGEVN